MHTPCHGGTETVPAFFMVHVFRAQEVKSLIFQYLKLV